MGSSGKGRRVRHAWDYFSEKDGEVHHFDLCESCYDELVGGFRIPVDVEEQTELLRKYAECTGGAQVKSDFTAPSLASLRRFVI